MKKLILVFILGFVSLANFAQTTNDVLELLIKNKTITQEQADSVRAEAAIKQQNVDANKKSFSVSSSRLMQLSGFTQVRYQFQQTHGQIDGFDLRRVRLDVRGDVSPYFSYFFQSDFVGTPKLIDAYADVKISDYLNFTIGQAKVPFSYENLISDNKMEWVDRSQVVEALVGRGTDVIGNQNGRDIGLQIGGSFLKIKSRYLFDYKIGMFNGTGINVTDKNDNKDVAGRLIAHPVKGLDFGGSFYSGTGYYGTPTAANHCRNRFGFEMNYTFNRFFVRGEFIEGKDGLIIRNGWYAETGYYLIPSRLQLVLKVDAYDPNTSVSKNVITNYLIGGSYQFNNWSRIAAGFTIKREEGPELKNNFATIQYQISF